MQGLRSGDEPPFLDVSGWTIRPSLWFDALCLIPLVAGVPFYTSRHVDDAQWWQRRFSADAAHASDALAVLRREITERAGKALPAFLALWTSPAAVSSDGSESCLEPLIEAVRDPRLLASAMRETSDHWSNADEQLFDRVRPALVQVLVGLRDAGLAEWWKRALGRTWSAVARTSDGSFRATTWYRLSNTTPVPPSPPAKSSCVCFVGPLLTLSG